MKTHWKPIYNFMRAIKFSRTDSTEPHGLINIFSDLDLLFLVISPCFHRNFTDPKILKNLTNPNFLLSLMVFNLQLPQDKRSSLSFVDKNFEQLVKSDYSWERLLRYMRSSILTESHVKFIPRVLDDPVLLGISQNPLVQRLVMDSTHLELLCNPDLTELIHTKQFWETVGDFDSVSVNTNPSPQESTCVVLNSLATTINYIAHNTKFDGFKVQIDLPTLLKSIKIENNSPLKSTSNIGSPPNSWIDGLKVPKKRKSFQQINGNAPSQKQYDKRPVPLPVTLGDIRQEPLESKHSFRNSNAPFRELDDKRPIPLPVALKDIKQELIDDGY